jgi:hypothetical protein
MILLLATDIHSVIYSFLELKDKLIYISLAKEIFFNSRTYRVLNLNQRFSEEYVLVPSFRERISPLVLLCHISLSLAHCHCINDADLAGIGNVGSLDLTGCDQITNVGLAYLSHIKSLYLSGCDHISDLGASYLVNHIVIHIVESHL